MSEEEKTLEIQSSVNPDTLSSVKISRNAKREVQLEVKVYHEDPHEAQAKAQEIYDSLITLY